METVSHEHLYRPDGFPAWLMIVELADGRFYLEDEMGDWNDYPTIGKRRERGESDGIIFYSTIEDAREAGWRLISQYSA